jgi:DNA-binding transcriptional ArsR family regulator
MARVFKALADESRRRMLDIVKANEGISVNGLADYFKFSRFAVMKHLRILEEANLLKLERDGRFKKIYLNSVPIQMIYDRWLSDFSRHWARGLTELKYKLEGNENGK